MFSVKILCQTSQELKNIPAITRLQHILRMVPPYAQLISIKHLPLKKDQFVASFHVNHGANPVDIANAIQSSLDDTSVYTGFFQVTEYKTDRSAGWTPTRNTYSLQR
jgi:hypothetical protein